MKTGNPESKKINLLITGAAGNLGGLLAAHLRGDPAVDLRLMVHRNDVSPPLRDDPSVTVVRADLADRTTLGPALEGVDVVVHFAGVLFMHNPEKFLPVTNTAYFRNLLEEAAAQGVRRVILVSFPHVEGETFPGTPARGSLDGAPDSVHARTRLEEERLLFGAGAGVPEPVSLRVGMVYGKGILMIDAARWLAKRRLLAVWRRPTWIHLVSKHDFLEATRSAVIRTGIQGIYHIGDDGVQTLQQFLDEAAVMWGAARPWRMPAALIFLAAFCCEAFSRIFGTRAPLTRDFVRIGMVSYYGDTARMKKELLEKPKYANFKEAASDF